MTRRTALSLVLTASLAVACWAAWMANRPACDCVLGDVSSMGDPADCEVHHGEVE